MEQQIAPTLWLPPGMCFLNPMPAMHIQPTTALPPHHMTSQIMKHQQFITVPANNIFQNQHLLQQAHMMPPHAQNILHIPGIGYENLLLPPNGKAAYEISPPLMEFSCPPLNLQTQNTTIIPSDSTFQRHILMSKIMKKKRISPSAKRRSRLRLIAFLESKKKQSETNSSDENTILQPSDDITYPDKSTTPSSSSDDVTLSPQSSS